MGLLLTNGNKEVNIGYIGFALIRQQVAFSFNKEVGDLYKKIYSMFDNKYTKEEENYLNEHLPKYLDKFLYHSDCDGHFCKRDVKGIYKELIKLKPIFNNENLENKYKEILDLFSQEERIDFY